MEKYARTSIENSEMTNTIITIRQIREVLNIIPHSSLRNYNRILKIYVAWRSVNNNSTLN